MCNAAAASRPGDGAKPGRGPVGCLLGTQMPGLGAGGLGLAGSEHRGWALAFPTYALGLTTGQEHGQIRTSWNEASPPVRQPLGLLSISPPRPLVLVNSFS